MKLSQTKIGIEIVVRAGDSIKTAAAAVIFEETNITEDD